MRIFCVFAILWCLTLTVSAQLEEKYALWINGVGKSRWFTYHLEKEDVLILKDKWNKIENSLASETNEFAGKYFQYGYMSGYFLIWSPENGFVFVQYFDVEHPCYFSYGKVSIKNPEIIFEIEGEGKPRVCQINPTPLIWIPADGGRYLIPKSEAESFGKFYAGFGEFNGFFRKWQADFPFAVRRHTDFEPKQNFILPKAFEKFEKKPITAEIISVGKKQVKKTDPYFSPFWDKSSVTPVTINAGRKHGVTKGLEFVLLDSNDADSQTLKITSVGNSISKGIVIRQVDDKGFEGYSDFDEKSKDFIDKPFTPIQIGLKITTSPIQKLDF